MIIFHSQQSDCARCHRKNENAATFNFTSQIPPSNLHGHFHEARTIVCNNLSSAVQAHVMELPLYAKQALPLNFVRFLRLAIRSPMIQRSLARRSRNVREPSGKKSGEMSRSLPHNFPAIAGQWQSQCRRISARVTRETTRNMARNARTAVRATDNAITSETSRKMARRNFVVTLSTMTPQNYEHITINTQP
jgi:hypothetical protein